MGELIEHDYETVTARCDHCGEVRTYNRIDDIGDPGPYAGRNIRCLVCGREFWVHGDIVNSADDLFIYNADEYFRQRRYMLCVANLAQAWEIFFSTFAHSNYIYNPFFTTSPWDRDYEQFNQVSAQLNSAIEKFPFVRMKNVVINTVLQEVHPATLIESEAAISRIVDDRFDNDSKKVNIDAFPDQQRRELIRKLQRLRVGDLRNKVVHHAA